MSVIPIWTVDKKPTWIGCERDRTVLADNVDLEERAQARRSGGHDGQLGHRKQAIKDDQTRDDRWGWVMSSVAFSCVRPDAALARDKGGRGRGS